MYDSIYNIWEQQQKLTDTYNQIYSSDLLKMQQRYSDIVTRMQSSITALQDISGLSTLAEQAMRMKDFHTDKFLSAWNHTMEIDRQLIQNMSSVLTSINIDHIASIAQQLTLSTEVIESFSRTLSLMQSENIISNLSATIQSIPDFVWDTLSDEEGCSKEEIQEELEVMQADVFPITDIQGLTPEQVKDKIWIYLWGNYPKVATVLMVILFVFSGIGIASTVKEFVIPMAQNAIVKMQGKEDIFFVKVESAKLYSEPNSHSTVITKILYAEQVIQIDSVKQWDKVIYINPDGEEVTGWIAKRNLMTYRDYEFNSNELYDLE